MLPNCKNVPRRSGLLPLTAGLALSLIVAGMAAAGAQDGPPGITVPKVFPLFDPGAPACGKPPGLAKVLAFAQDNQREFMQGVDRGLGLAARDRGLEYRLASANSDAAKQSEQVQVVSGCEGRRPGHRAGGPGRARPRSSADHVDRRLCRHRGATPGDDDTERAAISDRQGSG